MASHPYISGPGNITQMIGFLRKNFPSTVSSETVRKLSLASNNESYVINVLQFLGLIDEQGKRTERGHDVMTRHDEVEFKREFADIIKVAYHELFDLRGEDAWEMTKAQLVGFFRSADKTSEIIGGRQAGVFVALREIAGYQNDGSTASRTKPVTKSAKSQSRSPSKSSLKSNLNTPEGAKPPQPENARVGKSDMALTVRIEINLPAGGTKDTYDAIFKSIKENLLP